MYPFSLIFPLRFQFSLDEMMVLLLALLLDLISLILICVALDDFGLLDMAGWAVIGAWTFMKMGNMPSRPSRKNNNIGGKMLKRYTGVGLIELIPYIGVLPMWTLYVYITVKEKNEEVDASKREIRVIAGRLEHANRVSSRMNNRVQIEEEEEEEYEEEEEEEKKEEEEDRK